MMRSRRAARRARLRRDRPPPRDGRARRGHPLAAARRHRRGRGLARPPAGPRRGDDAAVRRPRHDHLDGRRSCSTSWRAIPEVLDDPGASVDMILDETLRKYPPAYIGPRRVDRRVRVRGPRPCPADAHVAVLLVGQPSPARRLARARGIPARSASREENKAKLPLGAYVPFGGGSRTCIGMRFGQAEIALIARAILERFRLELLPGHELRHPSRADDLAARRAADAGAGRAAGGSAVSRPARSRLTFPRRVRYSR